MPGKLQRLIATFIVVTLTVSLACPLVQARTITQNIQILSGKTSMLWQDGLSDYLLNLIETENVESVKGSASASPSIGTYSINSRGTNINSSDNNVLELNMNDGSITMYSFGEDIKYEENGIIKYKDTSIIPQTDQTLAQEGYNYTNGTNNFRINFSSSPAKGILIQDADGQRINFQPLPNEGYQPGQYVSRQIDEKAIDVFEYHNIFGSGTVLRYTPQLNSIRKDIILSAYNGRNTFSFQINTYGNLAVLCDDGKYIEIKDTDGNVVTTFYPIYAFDSYQDEQGDESHVTTDCFYGLTLIEPSVYQITLNISVDYLTNPNTVYPVTIDPNTSNISNSDDNCAYSSSTQNWQNHFGMAAGHSTSYGSCRAYAKFTLPSLPTGCTINSAYYYVRELTGYKTNTTIRAHRVTSAWPSGTMTWSNKPAHNSTVLDSKRVYNTSPDAYESYRYKYNITQAVKDWRNGAANYGIAFTGSDENSSESIFRQWATKEHGTSSYRPYAVITYTPDTTAPTISSVTKTPSGWTNGNVVLSVTASDSNPLSYSFDNGSTWQTGKSKTYTANASNIWIKVKDSAGNTTSYSSAQSITNIDKTSPTISLSTNTSNANFCVINASISDSQSGVSVKKWAYGNQSMSYFQSGYGTTINSSTIELSSNSTYTVYAKDVAGNEVVQTGTVTGIDRTVPNPPVISLSNTILTNQNQTITISYPNDAAVKQYRINNGSWQSYSAPFTVAENCVIEAMAVNNYGNSSISIYTVSNIDKTSPAEPTITDDGTTVTMQSGLDLMHITKSRTVKTNFTAFIFDGTWSNSSQRYYPGDGSNSTSKKLTSTTGTTNTVSTTIEIPSISGDGGYFSFYYSVSSEANYDYLRVLVDNAEKLRISGEVNWTRFEIKLTPGSHTISFEYRKDGSVDKGLDCAFIDYPRLTYVSSSTGYSYSYLQYCIDDGEWISGGDTITITPNRSVDHTVKARTIDSAGNISTEKILITTNPDLEITKFYAKGRDGSTYIFGSCRCNCN